MQAKGDSFTLGAMRDVYIDPGWLKQYKESMQVSRSLVLDYVFFAATAPFLASSANTIWRLIKATDQVHEGTVIPRSFELTTPNGRFWVHGNATEHMAEYAMGAARRGLSPDLVRLGSQLQLASFEAAVDAAAQEGIQYNTLMRVAGWELKFAPPRQPGQLPAIIHALYTGG
jgi:filamentous hemagglutinin